MPKIINLINIIDHNETCTLEGPSALSSHHVHQNLHAIKSGENPKSTLKIIKRPESEKNLLHNTILPIAANSPVVEITIITNIQYNL